MLFFIWQIFCFAHEWNLHCSVFKQPLPLQNYDLCTVLYSADLGEQIFCFAHEWNLYCSVFKYPLPTCKTMPKGKCCPTERRDLASQSADCIHAHCSGNGGGEPAHCDLDPQLGERPVSALAAGADDGVAGRLIPCGL